MKPRGCATYTSSSMTPFRKEFLENISVLSYQLKDKTNLLIYHQKLLAEALKEKDELIKQQEELKTKFVQEKAELKAKFVNFDNSSKHLSKLINSQLSAKDKTGLGFNEQVTESESLNVNAIDSIFVTKASDVEDTPTYDRFEKVQGFHVVPPPLTGNFIPPELICLMQVKMTQSTILLMFPLCLRKV